MILDIVALFKTPLDNSYRNVFDFNELSNLNEAKFRYFNFLSNTYERRMIEGEQILKKGFSLNFNETITVALDNDIEGINVAENRIDEFNYCYVNGVGSEAFYFITGYAINNSVVDKISVTFQLEKDVWWENYDKILNNPYKMQQITRRHTKNLDENSRVLSDFYIDGMFDDIQTVSETVEPYEVVPQYDILWQRLYLDPNKRYSLRVSDINFEIEMANGFMCSVIAVYRPVIIYKKFSTKVEGYTRINNYEKDDFVYVSNSTGFNYKTDTTYIIGADLTFNVPFDVIYDPSDKSLRLDRKCQIGQLAVALADGWENIGNGSVVALVGVSGTISNYKVSEISQLTSQHFLSDYYGYCGQKIVGETMTLEEIDSSLAETKTYPFIYFNLTTPSGLIPLNCKGKITLAELETGIRNFGCYHSYRINTAIGRFLTSDKNREFVTNCWQLPYSYSALQSMKESSINTFNVSYQNQLERGLYEWSTQSVRSISDSSESVKDVAMGAALLTTGYGTTLGSTMIAKGSEGLTGTMKNIVRGYQDYRFESKQITDLRNANIKDISNRASVFLGSRDGAYADIVAVDRVIVFINTPVKDDTYYSYCVNFHKYGTPRVVVDDYTINNRQIFDYIRVANFNINNITNIVEREIIKSVFEAGVTKWHIDTISNLSEGKKDNVKWFNKLISNNER